MTASVPTLTQTDHTTRALSRRTVIAGAAWSVPVIVAVTATPAFAAASSTSVVTATAPDMQTPAAGQVVVTAVVKDSSGTPLSGQAVAFTGPSGTSFSPTTATTDGSGTATSTLTTTDAWALPGSSVTVTALSNGASGSAPLTVLGANAFGAGSNNYHETGTTSTASSVPNATQLAYAFTSPIRSLASGGQFTLAALDDGTVWGIGRNRSGQLGDGTTQDRTAWTRVPGVTGAIAVAASQYYNAGVSYALLSNGTIMSWGSGWEGELGRGTVGTGGTTATPGLVQNISTAIAVAAGHTNGYALLSDGTVMAWGDNSQNQLGNGTSGGTSGVPAAVPGITTAVEIAAGSASAYARLNDGTILAWGRNDYGQLGNGNTNVTTTPTSVLDVGSNSPSATAVAAGSSSGYALLTDGTIAAWGVNASGELGNGTSGWDTSTATPATVSGITTATAITATYSSGYAFLSDGSLKAWGANAFGQLATGDTNNAVTPVTIPHTTNATQFAANAPVSNAFLLVVGDRVVTLTSTSSQITAGSTADFVATVATPAGAHLAGQTVAFAGDDAATTSPATATTDSSGQATTTVSSDTWTPPGSALVVTANSAGSIATKALSILGANAYGFGRNAAATAGTGTTSSVSTPTQLQRVFSSPIRSISSSDSHTLAVLADGTVWSIGRNRSGQLGDGTTTDRPTWAQVPGITDAVAVAASVIFYSGTSYALRSNGQILSWGAGGSGQLGTGSTSGSTTPTPVAGITTATRIVAGQEFALALLQNGTVAAWGSNSSGQLGNGTNTQANTPIQVNTIADAVSIQCGLYTSYALRADGTVAAWGSGSYGELGNETTSNSNTPVTVSLVGSSLPRATAIAAGSSSGYALLADGSIAAWGVNANGQLGNGSAGFDTNTATPGTVTGITSATRINGIRTSAYALLRDGTAVAWGANSFGQLGNGTTNDSSTPITIANVANVTGLPFSSALSNNAYLVR